MARIEKYTSSGYAKLAMEVTETGYSIENNDSQVDYKLWLERGSTWVYDLNNETWAEAIINGQCYSEAELLQFLTMKKEAKQSHSGQEF